MLRDLPGFGERFRYYPAISLPELDANRRWTGAVGFVHDVVAQTLGDALPAHEIYFAGPPVMAQAMQLMLAHRQVPPAQVHFDQFY